MAHGRSLVRSESRVWDRPDSDFLRGLGLVDCVPIFFEDVYVDSGWRVTAIVESSACAGDRSRCRLGIPDSHRPQLSGKGGVSRLNRKV